MGRQVDENGVVVWTDRFDGNVFNVRTFGAKGDAVLASTGALTSGTDDTAAVNAALAACFASGGGAVYFPAGFYRINSKINIPNDGVSVTAGMPGGLMFYFTPGPTPPSVGQTFTCEGRTYTVVRVGTGELLVSEPSYTLPTGATGTLTKGTAPADIPYTSRTNGYTRQVPIRITGDSGNFWQMRHATWPNFSIPDGGSVLILPNATTTTAKIVTTGAGVLEIDHLTFYDPTDGTKPYFLSTNTTVRIHDNLFLGKPVQYGCNAVQDCILLGGTDDNNNSSETSGFAGYGTVVQNNYFDYIRTGVWLRNYCNSTVIRDNTWWSQCGGDPNRDPGTATHGAIVLDGYSSNPGCVANLIEGNLIESTGYVYPVYCKKCFNNDFIANSFWDVTNGSVYVTCSAANATVGAYYVAPNGVLVRVSSTITGGTTLVTKAGYFAVAPDISGTLTKTSGTGDNTITYSAVVMTGAPGVASFTCSAANATVGATYTSPNGYVFTVSGTIVGGTTLIGRASARDALPDASGTLTKISGTGDATITYSAISSTGSYGADYYFSSSATYNRIFGGYGNNTVNGSLDYPRVEDRGTNNIDYTDMAEYTRRYTTYRAWQVVAADVVTVKTGDVYRIVGDGVATHALTVVADVTANATFKVWTKDAGSTNFTPAVTSATLIKISGNAGSPATITMAASAATTQGALMVSHLYKGANYKKIVCNMYVLTAVIPVLHPASFTYAPGVYAAAGTTVTVANIGSIGAYTGITVTATGGASGNFFVEGF